MMVRFFIVFSVLFLVLFAGCSVERPEEPDAIYLSAFEKGDDLVVFFLFTDSVGNGLPVEGVAELRVLDGRGNQLYYVVERVMSSDYVYSDIGVLGGGERLMKIFVVSSDSLDESLIDEGVVNLLFYVSDSDLFFNVSEGVGIPQVSGGEFADFLEAGFVSSASDLFESSMFSGVEVSLLRAGFFRHLEHGSWGDDVVDFRVDVRVSNRAGSKRYFSVDDAMLFVDGEGFEYSVESSLYSGELYPGGGLEGYLLFSDVPDLRGKSFDLVVGSVMDSEFREFEVRFDRVRL